jgi:hypothetical protein
VYYFNTSKVDNFPWVMELQPAEEIDLWCVFRDRFSWDAGDSDLPGRVTRRRTPTTVRAERHQ